MFDLFMNASIRNKVITIFGVLLVLVASLGGFSIYTMMAMNDSETRLNASVNDVSALEALGRDAEALVQYGAETHVMAEPDQVKYIPGADTQRQQILAQESKVEQDFATSWAAYSPTMDSGRETSDGQAINAAFSAIAQDAAQENTADQGTDNSIGAKLLLVSIQSQLASLHNALQDDLAYQQQSNTGMSNAAMALASSGILWSKILLGVIGLLTLLAGLGMTKSIANPITSLAGVMRKLAAQDFSAQIPALGRRDEVGSMAKAVQVFRDAGLKKQELEAEAAAFQQNLDMQIKEVKTAAAVASVEQKTVTDALTSALARLAQGDLTVRVLQTFSGTYEALKSDFNQAMEKLQETMQAIASNTNAVASGAAEISTASDDLSRRTEQQAASLEQTAAALTEITATVQQTAAGAAEASTVVSTAKTDAERSGQVVRQTVEAMAGIDQSSKQISNIIGVIDEIAFQTNLLALNAGVEAARAGDAGRGFAVVATEVRALAQRSADAAKEIKTLISASGQQVETGVKLVGETGRALGRIVEHVAKLNGLITNIAASAKEQSTGLAEVNAAVGQMDQVTQQNAAMVEESTAASHALNSEATELTRLLAQFQTGETAATPRPAPKAVRKSRIPPDAPMPRKAAPAPAGADQWDEF
jgi:methyl-accepting chemotaxis protein